MTEKNSSGLKVVPDNFKNDLAFNVMPDRMVRETLTVREYRVGDKYIEALFDREYTSEMLRSPDHLTAPLVQIHSQKLLYAYLCHHFNLPYSPTGPELLKIWCTRFTMELPKLVREGRDLLQKMHILRIDDRGDKRFEVEIKTDIENIITMHAVAAVYIIE